MNHLTRLAKIADDFDRQGRHADADAVTSALLRLSQAQQSGVDTQPWDGSQYNDQGQPYAAYEYNPYGQHQQAPAGKEWSPNGNLQAAGWGQKWEQQQSYSQATQQFNSQLPNVAYSYNPATPNRQPAPAGQEYSLQGNLQAAGTGRQWLIRQLQTQYPGWTPPAASAPTPSTVPAAPASGSSTTNTTTAPAPATGTAAPAAGANDASTIQTTLHEARAAHAKNGTGWVVINKALANPSLSAAAKAQLKQQFAVIAQQMLHPARKPAAKQ